MKTCPKCEQQCSEHRDVCPLCAVPLVPEPARPNAEFASTDWIDALAKTIASALWAQSALRHGMFTPMEFPRICLPVIRRELERASIASQRQARRQTAQG